MVDMRRRDFLSATAGALVPIAGLKSLDRGTEVPRYSSPGPCCVSTAAARTFEITTRIELDAAGPARAWIPLPLARDAAYQRDRGHTIDGNASRTRVERVDGAIDGRGRMARQAQRRCWSSPRA